MTHSPAPFVAGEEYDNHRNEIIDADGRCIAVVWTRRGNERTTSREQFKNDPQGMANWRLMIAAPELLQALEAIMRDCEEVLAGREPLTIDLIHAIAHGKPRAAIAKATGG